MAPVACYSIPRAQRGKMPKTDSQGPGAYEPDKEYRQKPPSWKIGTEAKCKHDLNDVPGAGTYDSPGNTAKKAPEYTMGQKYKPKAKDDFPAPGNYEPVWAGEKTNPCYTMRAKTNIPQDNTNKPAANAYVPNFTLTRECPTQAKFGTEKKCQNKYDDNPGPGTYDKGGDNKKKAPEYRFGTGDKIQEQRATYKQAPGPGNYDQKSLFDYNQDHEKGTCMVPKRPLTSKENLMKPGPGAYDPMVAFSKNRQPAHIIGSENRGRVDAEQRQKPGPGTYDPNEGFQSGSPPKYRFGTALRKTMGNGNDTPGPGNYDNARKIGEGPEYVMGIKTATSTKNAFIPGPGAYDPSDNFSKANTSKIGIGTANRTGLYRSNDNPGSGAYGHDQRAIRKKAPGWAFGSEYKLKVSDKRSVPGPGNYDIKSVFENSINECRGNTLVGRRPQSGKENYPGPGSYQPVTNQSKQRVPSAKIGTTRKGQVMFDKNPGPGNYSPTSSTHGRRAPAFGFGSENRGRVAKGGNPGPGNYEFQSCIGAGKKYYMGIKTNQSGFTTGTTNPGPGNYTAEYSQTRQSAPKIGFGSSKRGRNHDERVPGPGQYEPRPKSAKETPNWSFGNEMKLRGDKTTNKQVPGPGNYDQKTLFEYNMEKNMGTSMTSRRPQSGVSTHNRNPGPGEYNNDSQCRRPKSPSYKVGSEQRFGKNKGRANNGPGPGAYEQHENTKTRKSTDCKFGKDSRIDLNNRSFSPGPGHYDPRLDKSAPEYKIGIKTRPMSGNMQNPGPGNYNPSTDFTKENIGKGGRIGSGKRDKIDPGSNPGPGQYDTRGKIPGPHPRIGTECRKDKYGDTPGPGSYEVKPMIADVPAYNLQGPLKIHL